MLSRLDAERYSYESFKPKMRAELSTTHFSQPDEYIRRYLDDEKDEDSDRNTLMGQSHGRLGDFDNLPKDLVVKIIGYLSVRDVATNMSVLNKSWYRFLADPYFNRPYILSNMKSMVVDTMESGYAMEMGSYLLRSPSHESVLSYFQESFPGLTSWDEFLRRYCKVNAIWKGVPPFDGEHGLSIRHSAYNDCTDLIETLNRTSPYLMMTGRTQQDYMSAVDKLISTASELSSYLTGRFRSLEFKPESLRYFHEWQLFYQFRSDLALVAGCVSEVLILYEVFELLTSGNPNRQQLVIDCLSDVSKTREMTHGTWLAICNIQDNYLDRSLFTQSEMTLSHFDLLYPDELANSLRISSSENFIRSVLNSEKLCGILNRDYLYRLSHCKNASLFLESPHVIYKLDDSDIHTLMRLCSDKVVAQSPSILDINPELLNRISEEMWFYLARECVTYAEWESIYNVLSAEYLSILIVDHYKYFLLNDRNVLVKISPLIGSGVRTSDLQPWFQRQSPRVLDRLQTICMRERPDFWQIVRPEPVPHPPIVPTYEENVRQAVIEAGFMRPYYESRGVSQVVMRQYCLHSLNENDRINTSDFIDMFFSNPYYTQGISTDSMDKIIRKAVHLAAQTKARVAQQEQLHRSVQNIIRTASDILSNGTREERFLAAGALLQTDFIVQHPECLDMYRASANCVQGIPASRGHQLRCAMMAVAAALLLAVAVLGAAGTLGISTPVSVSLATAGTLMLVSGIGLFANGQRKGLSKAVHDVSEAVSGENLLADNRQPLLGGY